MNKARLTVFANLAAILSFSAIPSASADTSHLVVPGDTLWDISQTFHTTVPALQQKNSLTSDLIFPGQKLTVPTESPAASNAASTQISTGSSDSTAYTVQIGDTLWQLALDCNTSVDSLKSMNHLQSDTIYPGQSLQISGQLSAPSPTAASSQNTDPQLADAPTSLIPVYKEAGSKYGIPWTVLAAIHKIETNYSQSRNVTSSAGAQGPMQFMPSTFAAYGVSAPGHTGAPDIGDVKDAIYSTANMLAQDGFHASPDQALYAYNHSSFYVSTVKQMSQV